jgi:nucleoside-diphosphate-sugar epimerase
VPSVLITGGAEFVGSHVTEMFLARGYTVAVVILEDSGVSGH